MHRSGYRYTPWVLEAMLAKAPLEVYWLEESTLYRMEEEAERMRAMWGSH